MDKKKIVILGAVGVVILGVGAFTMMGGDDSAPKTTKSKKSSAKHPKIEGKTAQAEAKASGNEGQDEVVKSNLNVGGLDFHGSPAKGDSKNSGEGKPNVAPNQQTATSETTMRDGAPVPLALRDPFAVPPAGIAKKPDSKGSKMPMAGTGAPAVAAAKVNPASQNPGSQSDSPSGSSVPLSPMPAPMPGPVAGGAPVGAPQPGSVAAKVTPGKAAYNSEELPYSASGVVMGENPIGVVSDADGGQRMVRVGSKIGAGRVVRITKGAIFVEYNGKVKALKIGGGSGTVQKKQAHAGDPERTGTQ